MAGLGQSRPIDDRRCLRDVRFSSDRDRFAALRRTTQWSLGDIKVELDYIRFAAQNRHR
jgi:hypothetical protein